MDCFLKMTVRSGCWMLSLVPLILWEMGAVGVREAFETFRGNQGAVLLGESVYNLQTAEQQRGSMAPRGGPLALSSSKDICIGDQNYSLEILNQQVSFIQRLNILRKVLLLQSSRTGCYSTCSPNEQREPPATGQAHVETTKNWSTA